MGSQRRKINGQAGQSEKILAFSIYCVAIMFKPTYSEEVNLVARSWKWWRILSYHQSLPRDPGSQTLSGHLQLYTTTPPWCGQTTVPAPRPAVRSSMLRTLSSVLREEVFKNEMILFQLGWWIYYRERIHSAEWKLEVRKNSVLLSSIPQHLGSQDLFWSSPASNTSVDKPQYLLLPSMLRTLSSALREEVFKNEMILFQLAWWIYRERIRSAEGKLEVRKNSVLSSNFL